MITINISLPDNLKICTLRELGENQPFVYPDDHSRVYCSKAYFLERILCWCPDEICEHYKETDGSMVIYCLNDMSQIWHQPIPFDKKVIPVDLEILAKGL